MEGAWQTLYGFRLLVCYVSLQLELCNKIIAFVLEVTVALCFPLKYVWTAGGSWS